MENVWSKFYKAIKWNTAEALLYQASLSIHNLALFWVIGKEKFGLVGTVFSIIFLLIPILNLGFDKAMIANYSELTNSKEAFKKYFLGQLFFQLLSLPIAFFLVFSGQEILSFILCNPINCLSFPKSIWFVAATTVVAEGLKKSLKVFLQLSFLNRYSSILEISTLWAYISTVWILNFTVGFSFWNIFLPFLIQSVFSLIVLSFAVFKIFKGLKSTSNFQISILEIVHLRISTFFLQASGLTFSGNFLIPLLAYRFGLSIAAYLKLFSYIGGAILSLSEKIFGVTSGALFSGLKSNLQRKEALEKIQKRFGPILAAIICLIIISYFFGQKVYGASFLFLLALILENFYVVYEKYFLVEKMVSLIFMINLVSAILFFAFSFKIDLVQTLIILILIRLTAFVITTRLIRITQKIAK